MKRIVALQLDVDTAAIAEGSRFVDDLGADSLAIVELVLALEEQFEIEISDDDSGEIQTVADAIAYITERIRV